MNNMAERQIHLKRKNAAGFSLLELMIAMTVTLVLLGGATKLLTTSLSSRTRENRRSDALASTQRALNIMSREIANTGFGLDKTSAGIKTNGIVVPDCHGGSPASALDSLPTSIRVRANINNAESSLAIDDPGEDVTFVYQPANRCIVRYDRFNATSPTTVLASNVDSFQITYYDATDTPTVTVSNAVRLTLDVFVDLPSATPITANQPPPRVRLASDVTLRNAPGLVSRY